MIAVDLLAELDVDEIVADVTVSRQNHTSSIRKPCSDALTRLVKQLDDPCFVYHSTTPQFIINAARLSY